MKSFFEDVIEEAERLRDDDLLDDYIKMCRDKEDELNKKIVDDLMVGASDEYKESYHLFPLGLFQSPVRIPAWMFRTFPNAHKNFNLNDIEKVAMAHVIHFTNAENPTGYLQCSGNIENWTKCSVAEADAALDSLEEKKLVVSRELPPQYCHGHKRNKGYYVNLYYVHTVLRCYKMDIWS